MKAQFYYYISLPAEIVQCTCSSFPDLFLWPCLRCTFKHILSLSLHLFSTRFMTNWKHHSVSVTCQLSCMSTCTVIGSMFYWLQSFYWNLTRHPCHVYLSIYLSIYLYSSNNKTICNTTIHAIGQDSETKILNTALKMTLTQHKHKSVYRKSEGLLCYWH